MAPRHAAGGSEQARQPVRRRGFLLGTVLGGSVALAGLGAFEPDADAASRAEFDLGPRAGGSPILMPVEGDAARAFAVVTDAEFDGGADPAGSRDSSGAFRAAADSGRPVFVPTGTYLYEGAGIDHPAPHFVGAGHGVSTIVLGDGSYFVDSRQRWDRVTLAGLRFNGGAGCLRNSFSGTNVTDMHVVTDCAFMDYSECAISHNSSDHPYWKITRNIFRSNNSGKSMGIALAGLTDGSTIEDNEFLLNRVHVKLGHGGNNVYIQRNDFLRFAVAQGFPRIDVWIVPAPTDSNSGAGLVLTRCKFGNEFLDPADLRIVYADEDTGADNGSRFPLLSAPSTGWIGGHSVAYVLTNGIGDKAVIPLIYSTTSNILGGVYGPIILAGSSGAPIISTASALAYEDTNVIGPLVRATTDSEPLPDLVAVRGAG